MACELPPDDDEGPSITMSKHMMPITHRPDNVATPARAPKLRLPDLAKLYNDKVCFLFGIFLISDVQHL